MKLLTNCENLSRELVLYTLKVVSKAACDSENCPESRQGMYTGEIQPMRVKESHNKRCDLRNNL